MSRIKAFSFFLALLSLSVMAACNNESNDNSSDSESGTNLSQSETTTTFEAENGVVDIPADPERVVALQFAGDLLAVGIEPVGVSSTVLSYSQQLSDELANAEDVGEPSVEKVLEIDPDLIVAPAYLEDPVIEQLEQIAPTVAIPWGTMDPLEEVRMFGEMLNREEEAEEWITNFKEKAAEYQKELADKIDPAETVATYEIAAKQLVVYDINQRGTYNLYNMLDLSAPKKVQEDVLDTGEFQNISEEMLPEYAADHMFVTIYEEDGGAKRAKKLMESDIWQSLPAYEKNQIYFIPLEKFWFNDGLSLEKQMDIQVEQFLSENKS